MERSKKTYISTCKEAPFSVFIQTKTNISDYYQNPDAFRVIDIPAQKVNHFISIVCFLGVDKGGNNVLLGWGFYDLGCYQSYSWIIKEFKERSSLHGIGSPKSIITNLNEVLWRALNNIFKNSKQVVSQYEFISTLLNILGHPSIQLLQKDSLFNSMFQDENPKLIENKIQDIISSSEIINKKNRLKIINELRQKFWPFKDIDVYTAGMHDIQRSSNKISKAYYLNYLDSYSRDPLIKILMNFINGNQTEEESLKIPEFTEEMSEKEFILKELKTTFNNYAFNKLKNQNNISLKNKVKAESDQKFIVSWNNQPTFLVEFKEEKEDQLSSYWEKQEPMKYLTCNWSFYISYEMVWSHIFSVIHFLKMKDWSSLWHLKRWRNSDNKVWESEFPNFNEDWKTEDENKEFQKIAYDNIEIESNLEERTKQLIERDLEPLNEVLSMVWGVSSP